MDNNRKHYSTRFLNVYRVSREEYSPAEGGCYFDYYQPFISIPYDRIQELIFPTRWSGVPLWSDVDDDLTCGAVGLINAWCEEQGLILESTMLGDRKALPIYSACWQGRANARWYLEDEPYESMTRVWPHYE